MSCDFACTRKELFGQIRHVEVIPKSLSEGPSASDAGNATPIQFQGSVHVARPNKQTQTSGSLCSACSINIKLIVTLEDLQ